MCRGGKKLKNEAFLADFRFDTAENEVSGVETLMILVTEKVSASLGGRALARGQRGAALRARGALPRPAPATRLSLEGYLA